MSGSISTFASIPRTAWPVGFSCQSGQADGSPWRVHR